MKQDNWKSLKRIEPLSLAKIQSIISGILSLLFSILAVILSSFPVFGLKLPSDPLIYIFYATVNGIIAGFVLGFIIALLYNYLSKYIGTIKVELE